MNYLELRSIFLDTLRSNLDIGDLRDLVYEISLRCIKNGLVRENELEPMFNLRKYEIQNAPSRDTEANPSRKFQEKYFSMISSIFWSFVNIEVIAIGHRSDEHLCTLPFFQITENGKEWLKNEDDFIPEDPEGYLIFLKKSITGLDDVVEQYLAEALQTFNRGYDFAAAVMLGAASEKLIYLLANSLKESSRTSELDAKFIEALNERKLNQLMKKTYEILQRMCKRNAEIPYEVHEESVNSLNSLFDAIRIQRNDAVHRICPPDLGPERMLVFFDRISIRGGDLDEEKTFHRVPDCLCPAPG